ncbi:MAG: hypothetical protein RIF41_18840 [Polyangiaceae bacterium]
MFDRLSLPQVSVEDLAGKWRIVRTNFPMWLAGDKSRPCLEYGILDDRTLSDLVTFEKAGRKKSIRGVDRQDPALSCHFVWRGRGLLKLLRSDWYVVDLDRDVAAIYFTKTLFTPEGLDVVTRAATDDEEAVGACVERIVSEPVLEPHVRALEIVDHGAVGHR